MKLLVVLLLLIISLVFTTPSFAHLAGQPPFFKINGIYSDLYDVPTTSLVEFEIPQDKPPALYQVNEIIQFELDTNTLPIPPEILEITEFSWDFGDGSDPKSGLMNSYAYSKSGSYILEISAKTKDTSQPQLIQSTLINIVPDKSYQMPKAVILVNGQGVGDPLLDDVEIKFGQDFILDGSATVAGSSKIVEYFWDLGNGKSAKGEKVTYQYSSDQYAMFPVLRVKDENGLISDAFIQITNADNGNLSSSSTLGYQLNRNRNFILGGLIVGLGLVLLPFGYRLWKKNIKN